MKRKKKTDSLPELIQANDGVKKALDALIRGLTAKRSFAQGGRTVTEDDASTQVKAALGLLQWAASPPPKLSAKDVAPPGPKLSEQERDLEIRRILGVDDFANEVKSEPVRVGA